MRSIQKPTAKCPLWALATGIGLLVTMTGCQIDVGGQTLPSPYYMRDDVQYFPAGPEFVLSNEAAALRAARDQSALAPGATLPAALPPQPAAPMPAELLPPEAN